MKRLKPPQIVLLAVLALLDVCVLGGLGYAVFNSMRAVPEPQPAGQQTELAPSSTISTPASTPELSPTTAPAPTPTPTAFVATFEPGACAFQAPEGASVECGTVAVPENRAGDPNDTIRLAVAIYHSRESTAAPDPVVYLHGGPGGDAVVWSAAVYEEFVLPILQTHDLIVFDQRGSGLSEPRLDCQELRDVYLLDLQGALPPEERPSTYTNALVACRDRLTGQGVDLAAYTTAASAADVNDVVAALGYEQVNLYGISYGTRLAQAVMRDFPGIVRSAVLDSVLPIGVNPYEEAAVTRQHVLDVLFKDCAADPACSATYPDLETVYAALVEQLDADPVVVAVQSPLDGQAYDIRVDGAMFTSAVMWGLNEYRAIPIVPQTIYDTRSGDYAALAYMMALPMQLYRDSSLGVMLSINCHEYVFASTAEALQAGLPELHLTQALGLGTLYDSGADVVAACQAWGAAPFDPLKSEPLRSDVPAMLMAGEYDPTTPPAFAQQLAGTLNRSRLFEFRGLSHALSLGGAESCPLSVALVFLSTPSGDPFRTCVSRLEAPRFVVPFSGEEIQTEPFTSEAYGVSGVLPGGWSYVGEGSYARDASVLDPTVLTVQAAEISADEWLAQLSEQFRGQGLDAEPRAAGRRQANDLTWRVYTARYRGYPVDLAFAETGEETMLVALTSSDQERDALYEAVFLPVIEALVPSP